MKQKPTINKIKKCKKDSRTLSLQETDNEVGVGSNCCSTFLESTGLLAQGEWCNFKSKDRNAVITLWDPKTAEVKGQYSLLCGVFFDFLLFLFVM